MTELNGIDLLTNTYNIVSNSLRRILSQIPRTSSEIEYLKNGAKQARKGFF